MYVKIIICFLTVWFFVNLYLLIKVKYLHNIYLEYFSDKNDNRALKCKRQIIDVLKVAGLSSGKFGFAQPLGMNMVQSGNANVWSNMFCNDVRIVRAMLDDFNEAEGIFASRLKNLLNPFYWIIRIVYLPKYIIEYLGIETNNLPTKLLQLLYWIFTIVYSIYSNQINEYIQSFISNFLK